MRLAWVVVAGVLAVAVGFPLALLVSALARDPSALATLAEPRSVEALTNTLWLAVGTTAFATVLGVPLGVLVGRTDLPGVRWLSALAIAPYVVPPYVTAIAWIALANPTNGWVNLGLRALGLPAVDVYSLGGMIWVLGLESAPVVMLATADALGRIDASLEEQARVSGAGPLEVLRRVTLPLIAPSVSVSASFVFAGAAAAFGVPYLLATGSSAPSFVLTTRIAQALDLDPTTGRPVAIAGSLVLVAVSVVIPAAVGAAAARARVSTVTGKASRPTPLRLGRWGAVAWAAVAGFVAVGAVVPLAALVLLSVTDQVGRGFGPDNWSAHSYATVLGRPSNLAALGRSLGLAAGAATIATAFGAVVAVLAERTELPGRRWPAAVARAPYAVPGTVLALGLLLAWSQELRVIVAERVTFAFALADTGWLLLLAYAVKFAALPVGGIGAALGAVDRSLEEAARVSGAGVWGALARITAPLVWPSVASAWFLVFVPSFTEVTMSVLLSGPRSRGVGVLLFELQSYGDPPSAAALAVVVAAIAVGGAAAARRWA